MSKQIYLLKISLSTNFEQARIIRKGVHNSHTFHLVGIYNCPMGYYLDKNFKQWPGLVCPNFYVRSVCKNLQGFEAVPRMMCLVKLV